jgi:hypothetical protein
MGLNVIRNKPDYEEIAGTGSNGYDRNTAEIRSFWNSDSSRRLRKKPLLTNETGSYNCFNLATYYVDESAILKSETKLNIYSSSFYSISMSCLIDTNHLYYKSFFELDSNTKIRASLNSGLLNINFNVSSRLERHSVCLLYWYITCTKGTQYWYITCTNVHILTLRAASQGSTFWRFIWTAFMCLCRRFCLMSKVPYALMRIQLRMRMESVAVISTGNLCQQVAASDVC